MTARPMSRHLPFTRLPPAHAVPRLASAVLADLVTVAEEIVAHAAAAIAPPALLADIRAEVERLVMRPVAEGERIADDAELMLVQAIEHVAESSGRMRAKWVAIAAALLEQVRRDGAALLEAETRPAPREREAPR